MAMRAGASVAVAAVAALSSHTSAFVDTASWIGAEYTPAAAAANDGWMRWYPLFAPSIERELPLLVRRLAFTALRVFISPVVWEHDGEQLLVNMDAFMAQAHANGLRVGWVFFDDCFNGTQMSMDEMVRACVCSSCRGGVCACDSCWRSVRSVQQTILSRPAISAGSAGCVRTLPAHHAHTSLPFDPCAAFA
jgi:hypothetical protein